MKNFLIGKDNNNVKQLNKENATITFVSGLSTISIKTRSEDWVFQTNLKREFFGAV
jgi:hypothetical protein